MIRSCGCSNRFQDQRYGQGRRVFTENTDGAVVCTACGKPPPLSTSTAQTPAAKPKKEKKK